MLDFIKEPKDGNGTDGKDIERSDVNMKNAEPAPQDDYFVPAVQDKTVRQSTIMLAALFVIGALCVLFMIKKTSPKQAGAQISDEDMRFEQAVAQITGSKVAGIEHIDTVVRKFYEVSNIEQVPVDALEKNPFKQEILVLEDLSRARLEMENPGTLTGDALVINLAGKISRMQLVTIIQTPQGNCCMIDDSILSVGQSINGFKVIRIDKQSVELVAEGQTFTLTLSLD